MAKSKYDNVITPNLKLIERWYRNGSTDEEVSQKLNISKTTLYKYVEDHSELSELRKKSKEIIDSEVEEALLKKSLGYEYTETTREERWNNDTKKYEMAITKEVTKQVAPDTTAMIFWLKNRQPELWKDKHEVKHSGAIKLEDIL